MMRTRHIQRQKGFTIIEALLSTLVLAIALLALAGFHAVALQDGSLVKARSIAANLAQEKLDDLRSFTFLTDGNTVDDTSAASTTNYCGQGAFCFSEIAGSSSSAPYGGGKENTNGTLLLPAGTVSGYIDNYSRSWTVLCSSEAAATAPSFSTTCDDSTVAKLVTVTVSWTTSQGSQTTSLQAVIYAMDPAKAGRAAVGPTSSATPVASYTPNADSVPISIGGGKSTETSKPLPEISGAGSKEVSLPSVVYQGSSGNETLVSQEDFKTVNCTCTLEASGTGWTPHRTVWNGSGLEQEHGEEVTKPVGVPNDLSNNGTTNQSDLCIECCRDHHDKDGYPAYRPYVATTEFVNGNHKHYKADGTLAAAGDDYVEACRMKRVDGYWRVVPDWLLVDVAVFGCDFFVSSATAECPPSASVLATKQDTFRNWVKAVLKSFVHYMDVNKAVDTATGSLPSFTSGVSPMLNTSSSADDINVTYGGNKQLIARAIYADVIFKKQSTGNPRQIDEDYVTTILPIYSADNFDLLQYLPFYDANMTLLARWSPTSTNTSGPGNPQYGDCNPTSPTYNTTPSPSSAVCVTSEAIDTIDDPDLDYYDDFYSRGKIYGKASSGSTLISASVPRGNNGLTDSASIDGTGTPQYGAALSGTIKATVPSLNLTSGLSGRVIRGNSGALLSKIAILSSLGLDLTANGTCVFTSPGTLSTASAATFTCTVTSGWIGTLTFADTDVSVTYSFTPSATTSTLTAPATVPDVTAYGNTLSLYGRVYTSGNNSGQISIGTSTGHTCSLSGDIVTCTGLPLNWSGTVTVANKAVCGKGGTSLCSNNIDVGSHITDANDCTNADGTGAKTSSTITATFADVGSTSTPSAFTFCAK